MIINPSAHTVIPCKKKPYRTGNFPKSSRKMNIPGGKLFFFSAVKIVAAAIFFLIVSSLWLGSSIRQVDAQISKMEKQRDQLVDSNIAMRAKRANMFSPETVGAMVGDQLAIHLPQSGQYKFLR